MELFEALNGLFGLSFGLPQETLHILDFVPQVVVGLLQDLHLLRKVFDFLFLLKQGLLYVGAPQPIILLELPVWGVSVNLRARCAVRKLE